MAPTNRRPVPRKRPASRAGLLERARQGGVAEAANVAEDTPLNDQEQQLRDALRRKIEATLQDNPDLDEQGRDFLLDHLLHAVESAPIEPTLVTKPDRGQWIQMLEGLRESGFAADDDVAALIRQFDDAMQPLDRPEVKLAAEFARRCEQDGEEKALAWLEAQRDAAAQSKQATSSGLQDARVQPRKPNLRRTRTSRGPPV